MTPPPANPLDPTQPHPDRDGETVSCALLTVSDTRTEADDRSGQIARERLQAAGHAIAAYAILPDDPAAIAAQVRSWCNRADLDAIVLNGGTGIAPRDTTYDAIAGMLEKTLPGFGEIFRTLSYEQIGSRAIASRAVAGVRQGTLVFSLPGSSKAVELAMDRLIVPELVHLVGLLRRAPR